MSVLAKAPAHRLAAYWDALPDRPAHRTLRPAERGLVMVRGRAGGTGQKFNLGEATVTRCSVAVGEHVGHAYVAGRDLRHAELAALSDALLQDPAWHDRLQAELIRPLASESERAAAERAAKVAATKVDFFTLVRGDNA